MAAVVLNKVDTELVLAGVALLLLEVIKAPEEWGEPEEMVLLHLFQDLQYPTLAAGVDLEKAELGEQGVPEGAEQVAVTLTEAQQLQILVAVEVGVLAEQQAVQVS